MSERPFFVGYLPAPSGLRGFLALAGLCLAGLFAGMALAMALTARDTGDGALMGWEDGVQGVIVADAYPLLHVVEDSPRLPAGSVVVMSALNKNGVADRALPLAGRAVSASGLYTLRGDVVMLQLRFGEAGLAPREGAAPPPEREALGRWRLTGEICDGKCYAGAMRPGRGLSHKACANLCVLSGVPPIFVLEQPFEGREYLLVTTPDGRPVGPETMDLSAILISAEGEVERVGDLLIFRLDPGTTRRL